MIDDRQSAMRIDISIAVARKVFRRGDHVLALDPFNKRDPEFPDSFRIFAEGTDVDHRVFRVVINVEHRRVNMIDPDRSGFSSGYNTDASRVFRIAGGSDSHRPWEIDRVFEP